MPSVFKKQAGSERFAIFAVPDQDSMASRRRFAVVLARRVQLIRSETEGCALAGQLSARGSRRFVN